MDQIRDKVKTSGHLWGMKKIDTGMYRTRLPWGDNYLSIYRIGHRGKYRWEVILRPFDVSLVVFPTKREAGIWINTLKTFRQLKAIITEQEEMVRVLLPYKNRLLRAVDEAIKEATGYGEELKDCTPNTEGYENHIWWETRARLLERVKEVIDGTKDSLMYAG
jgi:hypothetical protein